MAGELIASFGFAFSKNSIVTAPVAFRDEIDVTGGDAIERTQIIGSSEEALDVGEIGTAGYAFFFHTGKTGAGAVAAGAISIRPSTGAAAGFKMKAGEKALVRLAGNAPFAICADSSAPVLAYKIVED